MVNDSGTKCVLKLMGKKWGLFACSALVLNIHCVLKADFQNAIQFLLLKITLRSLELEIYLSGRNGKSSLYHMESL